MTFTEEALFSQRERIVRQCARITRNPSLAEDLAQDVLIQAWCRRHDLCDPASLPQWLARIAYNQCLMWLRAQRRDWLSSPWSPDATDGGCAQTVTGPEAYSEPADTFDVELELERQELSELLVSSR